MDMMDLIATQAEAVVHDTLADTVGDPFHLDESMLFGMTVSPNGVVRTDLLDTHPDIYDLLDTEPNMKDYGYAVVVTTGWAAPLDENGEVAGGAPSKNPMRRRVRLVICANREMVASVLRFQDASEDIIVDSGEATGSLNDAVRWFASHAL